MAGGSELIGYAGAGTFTQKAGSNKLTGTTAILDVGVQTGSIGTYTLSGGTLSTIMETVGDSGKGTFTQSGKAVHTVNGKLIIGNIGTGTFTLLGGTVAVKGIGATTKLGVNAKSSGTLTVTAAKLTTPSLAIGSAGAGHVTINAGGTIAVAKKVTIATGSTLTLVKGSLNIGTSVLSKTGTVSIGKGGSLTGAGTVTGAISEISTGTLQAKGGILTLAGPVGGGGALGIAGGATLDLVGKDANAVKFLAATGTLRIEKTAVVTGKIAQLQIGDVIDITITITKASLSGSKLTLTKSGGGTIVLTLGGTFTGDKFTVQSDNHGGSDILLQKASATAPSLGVFSQYVAAGFHSPNDGHGATTPVIPPLTQRVDLAHSHA